MTKRLILTYLVPCRLITKHTLPTTALLSPYPRLQILFSPVAACIKRGDLAGFDAALIAGEDEFVKRRIYLTLERGRDVTLRNLLRKVFLAGGYEPLKEGQTEAERIRRTRIPISEFAAALKLGMGVDGQVLEGDEVECMIANMIYKVCPFSLTSILQLPIAPLKFACTNLHLFNAVPSLEYSLVWPPDALQAAYEVTSLTHACRLHVNEASLSFCSQVYVS